MFADSENIQSNLVRELDLLQQVLHAVNGFEGETRGRIRDRCCEAVHADLHFSGSCYAGLNWMSSMRFGRIRLLRP
jgi:hypothetical protein